jgi:hypothetical protein
MGNQKTVADKHNRFSEVLVEHAVFHEIGALREKTVL